RTASGAELASTSLYARIVSPATRPAACAGEPGSTDATIGYPILTEEPSSPLPFWITDSPTQPDGVALFSEDFCDALCDVFCADATVDTNSTAVAAADAK